MKRILLVNTNTEDRPYPVPPLGLGLVAGALTEEGWKVQVYDGTFRNGEGLEEEIRAFAPHYVGVGIRNIDDMVMQRPTVYTEDLLGRFIEPIRRASEAPLILGGSGFSLYPRLFLDALDADAGIVGEGEKSLIALLRAWESGATGTSVSGAIFRHTDADTLSSPLSLAATEMRPSELHRFVDLSPYRKTGAYPIQTKRGCSRLCLYCTYPILEGFRERTRDPADVADEIEAALDAWGDGVFEFVDTTFNHPLEHAEALLEEILSRKLKVRLRTMGLNPRGAQEELLETMKLAGFEQIDCTPDSASPAVLKAMGKGFSKDDLIETAKAIRAVDLPTMWFFLLGGPGETPRTLSESLDFIDEHVAPDDMVYLAGGLRIYPGTGLHHLAFQEGRVKDDDDLLAPRFYVSPGLTPQGLQDWIETTASTRPNCVPAWDTRPDEDLLERARALHRETGEGEPRFRTLVRARRQRMEESS